MATRPTAVLSLVVLLVLAGCAGAGPLQTTGAATDESPPSISVSAGGSVAVEPDLAVVTVAAETTADSADDAREAVAADVAAVREALADLGIEDDAITTAYFRIDPQYDHSRETREVVGYRAVHALTVESDVEAAGEVVDTAVSAGAARVDGVRFTLTDDRRQTAREQALGEAMDNAAADAEALATAGDLSIDGIRSVATGGPTVIPVERQVAADGDAAQATTIESGPVTVRATVQVVYSAS